MTNPLAAALVASNPTPAMLIAAVWIETGILDAPLCVQDLEFLRAVNSVERA